MKKEPVIPDIKEINKLNEEVNRVLEDINVRSAFKYEIFLLEYNPERLRSNLTIKIRILPVEDNS